MLCYLVTRNYVTITYKHGSQENRQSEKEVIFQHVCLTCYNYLLEDAGLVESWWTNNNIRYANM